jgi:hypothetical protein
VRAALVLAGAAALACPGAAAASDYGGGTVPQNKRSYEKRLTIVTVRTAPGGTAVVRAWVQARCGGAEMRRRVTLAADGSFSVRGTVRGRAREDRRVRRTARIAIAGRVAGPAGSGTARARFTFRRGGRVVARCRSGPRAWKVRAGAPQPAAGPPRAHGAYRGLTSQAARRPRAFLLRVGGSARRVRVAVFQYRLRCRGGFFETSNVTPGGRIRSDGTFHLRERFTLRYSDANERYRVRVDGRFTATGVIGTLSVRTVARTLSGRVFDRCRTGTRRFAGLL